MNDTTAAPRCEGSVAVTGTATTSVGRAGGLTSPAFFWKNAWASLMSAATIPIGASAAMPERASRTAHLARTIFFQSSQYADPSGHQVSLPSSRWKIFAVFLLYEKADPAMSVPSDLKSGPIPIPALLVKSLDERSALVKSGGDFDRPNAGLAPKSSSMNVAFERSAFRRIIPAKSQFLTTVPDMFSPARSRAPDNLHTPERWPMLVDADHRKPLSVQSIVCPERSAPGPNKRPLRRSHPAGKAAGAPKIGPNFTPLRSAPVRSAPPRLIPRATSPVG